MAEKEVMLVSQRGSTMISMYKYSSMTKEVGRQKRQQRGSATEEGIVEKKNLLVRSLGRELVEGQMTTQMIRGD